MFAAPWWQQLAARGSATSDVAAMAICSVGNSTSGGGPAHPAAGHCQLCSGGQWQHALPASGVAIAWAAGASYPLPQDARAQGRARLAPGNPQARAPPVA
ncbi:DUF2946 family protein [Herbaspirillum sp. LeCh32-8]|nr:DUF2946 family protein [Herbaspirillum sp. LeCh32-8]MBP0600087.1 DUF2946 family protein [Herbaspirillum sp. LeCh32-8]